MGIGEIIALISLTLFWVGTGVGLWTKMKLSLKELEVKINFMDANFKKHCADSEKESAKVEANFTLYRAELRETQERIITKFDILIDKFNIFQIYVEKEFKTKDE